MPELTQNQEVDFEQAVKKLPVEHRNILAEALEHYYDVAKEEYADGSGDSSPEQDACADLQDIALKYFDHKHSQERMEEIEKARGW